MKASIPRHRDFSAKRIIFPVSKFSIQVPLLISPTGYRQFYPTNNTLRSHHSKAPRRLQAATTRKSSKLKLRLLGILALLCPEFRGHQKIATAGKKAQAMVAITPQEFLF
jgi:hypothetical protein